MMASPVSYLCAGVVVIKEACKVVYKCMPPFPVLKEFAHDIVKLTNDVNFRLLALPFKVAKALRRIIHMPPRYHSLLHFGKACQCVAACLRPRASNLSAARFCTPVSDVE